MGDPVRIAKVKLVTIVLPSELSDSFTGELAKLGVRGYTSVKAEGRGHHGARRAGVFLSANVRIEVLTTPEAARAVFALVESHYAGQAVVAFAADVEAVPYATFA